MKFSQFKQTWGKLILAILFIASFIANSGFSTANISNQQAISYIEPFLYPPYYGSTSANYIMDHDGPNNKVNPKDKVEIEGEGYVVAYNGIKATCPSKDISGCVAQINGKDIIIDYDNHEGIDYGISFASVLAAADTKRVDYAGWYNPQHRGYIDGGFGLMVVLEHLNGYRTLYGHLSSIAVPYCGDFYYSNPSFRECKGYLKDIKHGTVIGISGSTGHSDGPHLHFSVLNFDSDYNENYHKYMDPYGWDPVENADRKDDPLAGYSPPNSLWVEEYGIIRYPNVSLTNAARLTLPSGPSIPLPPEPDPIVQPVDDSDSVNFEKDEDGCWKHFTHRNQAVNDSFFYAMVSSQETCQAKWKLPSNQAPGLYDVYVHLAWTNDIKWAEVVRYQIFSGGGPIAEIMLDAKYIVENVLSGSQNADPTVASGWIYIGQYTFSQSGDNYVKLTNQEFEYETADLNVLADAVKFVPVNVTLPPTPTATPPSSSRTIRVPISQSSDDGGTNPGGCSFSSTDNEVYLGACFNGQNITSGFRFNNVQIPRNASITSAYIEFMVDGRYEVPVSVDIFGEASGDSLTFSASNQPENRLLTQVHTVWDIPSTDAWNLRELRETPNFHFIIEEIVRRPDWNQGNALSLIFKNHNSTNVRRVIAIDRAISDPSLSVAELVITYDLNSSPTATPTPITSTPVPPTSTPTPTATSAPTSTPGGLLCQLCNIFCPQAQTSRMMASTSNNTYSASFSPEQTGQANMDVLDIAELLYRVRDELMSQSSEGQRLTTLYYTYGPQIAQILFADEDLYNQGFSLIELFVPNLKALADGKGSTATITADQVKAVQVFLDEIVARGNPELQQVIKGEMDRHPLANMIGLTMDEAWSYLNGYQIEWLPPLNVANPYSSQQGRTIPIEFTVTDLKGNFVIDKTLTLQVLDSNGNVVFGPVQANNNPTNGITIQGKKYHYNLETKSLAAGSYIAQITYNSMNGVQSVMKAITLTKKK